MMAGIPKKLKAALLAATIAGGGVGGYPPSVVLSFAGFQKVTGIMLSHGPAWTGLILCRRSY